MDDGIERIFHLTPEATVHQLGAILSSTVLFKGFYQVVLAGHRSEELQVRREHVLGALDHRGA